MAMLNEPAIWQAPSAKGSGLVNLTQHDIVLVSRSEDDLDAPPRILLRLPPSGIVARCAECASDSGDIDISDQAGEPAWVPVIRLAFGAVSGLPDPRPGTQFIVSRIVADARPDRADLLVPARLLRGQDGAILGCCALARVAIGG